MAIKSIPCGGFFYDDETISFEKDEYGRDVISATGGGSTQTPFIVNFNLDDDEETIFCNKTYQEVKTAIMNHEKVMASLIYIDSEMNEQVIINCAMILGGATDDSEVLGFSFWNERDGIYAITVLYDKNTQSWKLT